MNLLVGDATKAGGVEPEPALLRTDVGTQVELRGSVAVDVAVQASDAEAGLARLAVVRRIELLLWERGQQHSQPIELDGGQDVLEQPVEVVDRHDFATRNVAQLGTVAQEDRGRELGN